MEIEETADSYIVTSNGLISEIFKDSYGYNQYRSDVGVIVYDARVTVQYLSGTWKPAGIAQSVTYEPTVDGYNVTRHYEGVQADYDVVYVFRDGEDLKYAVTINSKITEEYRVAWSLDGVAGDKHYILPNKSVMTKIGSISILDLNVSDVVQAFGDDAVTITNSTSAQGRKLDYTFGSWTISAGESLVIDPKISGAAVVEDIATSHVNGRKLVRTSFGDLWAVYEADDNEIWIVNSTDEGVTWNTPLLVNNEVGGGQITPSIAIDRSDTIHIIWSGAWWGTHGGFFNIQYRNRSSAGVWGNQEEVNDIAEGQYTSSIAIDSDDIVHIVWHGTGWGDNPFETDIQYRNRTSSGWGTQESVTDAFIDHQRDGCIAIDNSDNVHVVWYGTGWGANSGNYNIQYRNRTDIGWGTRVGVTDEAYQQFFVSCAIDSNDYVHVAWEGYSGSNHVIYYRNNTDGWNTRRTVVESSDNHKSPSISLNSNDDVHILWVQDDAGSIYYVNKTSSAWGSNEVVASYGTDTNGGFPGTMWSMWPQFGDINLNVNTAGAAYVYTNLTGDDSVWYDDVYITFSYLKSSILLPTGNATYGKYGTLPSENAYSTGITLTDTVSGTAMGSTQYTALSTDDTSYVTGVGTNKLDAYVYVNFTVEDVDSVYYLDLKVTGFGGGDWWRLGAYNITDSKWYTLDSYDEAAFTTQYYTISSDADIAKYMPIDEDNNLTFSIAVWTDAGADDDMEADLIQATLTYKEAPTNQTYEIDKSETIIITDSIELTKTSAPVNYSIDKSDTIMISDEITITKTVAPVNYSIDKADTITYTDSIEVTKIIAPSYYNANTSETITYTDTITITKTIAGVNYSIDKAETITYTDSIAVTKTVAPQNYSIDKAETITISDDIEITKTTAPVNYSIDKADTITLSDEVTITKTAASINYSIDKSDTITISDGISVTKTLAGVNYSIDTSETVELFLLRRDKYTFDS